MDSKLTMDKNFISEVTPGMILMVAPPERKSFDKVFAFLLLLVLPWKLSRSYKEFIKFEKPQSLVILSIDDATTMTVKEIF